MYNQLINFLHLLLFIFIVLLHLLIYKKLIEQILF